MLAVKLAVRSRPLVVKVWGSQKLHAAFCLHGVRGGSVFLTPALLEGELYSRLEGHWVLLTVGYGGQFTFTYV